MATTRTVRQLIESALRVVGVLAPGETPSADDTTTAKIALQDLLAEWGDGGLMVPCITTDTITMVIDQATYTIGQYGSPDKTAVRPEQIIGAYVRQSNYDYKVEIIGEAAYADFLSKSSSSSRPTKLWYNPTSPNGTISVWRPPDTTDSLYIRGAKPFTEPTTLTENLLNTTEIPRNYHAPLKWNLALELCPEYGREPSQIMVARAQQGYNRILALNAARRAQAASLECPGVYGLEKYSVLTG